MATAWPIMVDKAAPAVPYPSISTNSGQSKGNAAEKIKQKLRKRYWLGPKQVSASYIRGGSIEDALDQDDELTLIKNELIDQASVDINNMSDFIIDKNFEDSDNAEHQ